MKFKNNNILNVSLTFRTIHYLIIPQDPFYLPNKCLGGILQIKPHYNQLLHTFFYLLAV